MGTSKTHKACLMLNIYVIGGFTCAYGVEMESTVVEDSNSVTSSSQSEPQSVSESTLSDTLEFKIRT